MVFVDISAQLQERGASKSQTLCYADLEVVHTFVDKNAPSGLASPPAMDSDIFDDNEPRFFVDDPTKPTIFHDQTKVKPFNYMGHRELSVGDVSAVN